MEIPIYQVDAFSSGAFAGNPAAVCPLEEWLPDETLQAIAAENNLSETAYFVRTGERFALRWFTPGCEVDLCGHATLASAYVLFHELGAGGRYTALRYEVGRAGGAARRRAIGDGLPFPPARASGSRSESAACDGRRADRDFGGARLPAGLSDRRVRYARSRPIWKRWRASIASRSSPPLRVRTAILSRDFSRRPKAFRKIR